MATKKTTNQPKTAKESKTTRPTKKQHELLAYLQEFITEHGYSPSYREIMRGCNYTSVATVALHINNLIKRGHVVKRDKSARSLEVVSTAGVGKSKPKKTDHSHELIEHIEQRFTQLESAVEEEILSEVYVLVGALKILGHVDIARAYATRINQLQLM